MIKKLGFATAIALLNYVLTQATTTTTTTTQTQADTTSKDTTAQPLIKLQCDPDKKGKYQIGESVYLCLHLLPKKQRMAFQVTVDAYEILTVSGIYLYSKKDTTIPKSGFVVQLGDSLTPYESSYYNQTAKTVFSMMNIVIKMSLGEITGIAWDNYCWDCAFNLTQCITTSDILGFKNSTEIYSEMVCSILFIII